MAKRSGESKSPDNHKNMKGEDDPKDLKEMYQSLKGLMTTMMGEVKREIQGEVKMESRSSWTGSGRGKESCQRGEQRS